MGLLYDGTNEDLKGLMFSPEKQNARVLGELLQAIIADTSRHVSSPAIATISILSSIDFRKLVDTVFGSSGNFKLSAHDL